ncbi:nucleotide sugar dehydrogenase [Candidatus Woesearchaeota archaeon]|nr:nucleotide sugar dehydrogenase [Candidatus Woesearchaeota archaeon]
MRISVIGLGKAGLPLAAVIADSGIPVLGVDLDRKKVEMINKGINPIEEEPGLKELIKKCSGKTLKATADAANSAKQSNVHIVIVPLFIDKGKKPDFSILKNAFETLSKGLKKDDVVVLETTVPVGTTENLAKSILENGSGLKAGIDFCLAYSPERIMTGYSVSRYREFPKIVGGINKKSTDRAFEVYEKFSKPVKASNARTAELAKISEGVYRDVNIALANELFKVCEKYEIDFWEMKEAAKHQYCNILEPGNVGGHCIPVYPWFLINELEVPLTKTARAVNDDMVGYYAKKIENITGKKKNARIGVIGLSYREGVKEKAYSRSIALIALLKKKGYEVYGLDPLYSKEETKKEFDVDYLNNLNEMNAVILMNKEIKYKDKLKPIKNKVVDVKNVLG